MSQKSNQNYNVAWNRTRKLQDTLFRLLHASTFSRDSAHAEEVTEYMKCAFCLENLGPNVFSSKVPCVLIGSCGHLFCATNADRTKQTCYQKVTKMETEHKRGCNFCVNKNTERRYENTRTFADWERTSSRTRDHQHAVGRLDDVRGERDEECRRFYSGDHRREAIDRRRCAPNEFFPDIDH